MASNADDFKSEVRARRQAAGLTQAELAEAAGISERGVSDLERGLRTHVYPNTARRLAHALAVPDLELSAFLIKASASPPARDTLAAAYRSQLPEPPNPLIGRDAELSLLLSLIRSGSTRLITVVGVGGCGKTRLAVEAARFAREDFAGNVLFIDLSSVDTAAQVPAAIADGTGARLAVDPLHSLMQRFAALPTLLVLDTLEHVLEAGAAITELVRACASLQVLVTSRSPLNVRGERLMRLEPLSVTAPPGETAPAAQLFLDRVRGTGPGTRRTDATDKIAATVASRLDGLPLAIELAAARAMHMPLEELVASLNRRLASLSGGPRDGEDRHRTMRAALDWSYTTLDGQAQRQLRALSVFRGGFDLDAVAAVDGPGWTDHRTRVVDALGRLVEHSLVVFTSGTDGAGRYRVLDVVRDYGRELAVEDGESATLRRRHAAHYLAVAEQGEPHLRGAEQREWYLRLLADESNFRAALSWALDRGETETALRLAAALWMFWRWAGLFTDAKQWVAAALASGEGPPALRMRVLWAAGWLAYHRAEYAQTAAAGRDILRLAGDDDSASRRNGLTLISIASLAAEQMDEAVAAAGAALELAETSGDGWLVGTSLLNLGTALRASGDATAAIPLLLRACAQYLALGDRHFLARTLIELAHSDLVAGQTVPARTHIREALGITRGLGDLWSSAEGLEAAAVVCADDDAETAVTLFAAAGHIRARIAMNAHPPDQRLNGRYLEKALAQLDPGAIDAAYRRGTAMTTDEALQVAANAVDALLSGG